MSKSSSNMLRTRRRDNNVKPNRRDSRLTRLDRKSSRGMIYENEELRLKTININAEIERGQSDIKKLKRENEMLKKEIWCLRDEYDKLDKLLKDKKIDFSSSSTTCSSSDSDSDSSCSDDSDEVETSQNLENVQKTNLENIHREFDHLSVVVEENSAESSDKTSNRASLPNDQWNFEKDVLKADQSYPIYPNQGKSQTLPNQEKVPTHFFSPIKTSKSYDENSFNQDTLYPSDFYSDSISSFHHNVSCPNYVADKKLNSNFYQNIVLAPNHLPETSTLDKSSTDLLVKLDNCNFDNRLLPFPNTSSQSTFSNGGNLEELLNDIESISQRNYPDAAFSPATFHRQDETQKPFKSELNVVLMPNPMPLIGFDKYRNMQRSFESIHSRNLEDMSVSQQDLCIIPPPPPLANEGSNTPLITISANVDSNETNPFFFGNLKDNYVNSDYFNVRYNPDNFIGKEDELKQEQLVKSNSKSNLLELPSSDQPSSENEENLKFKTSKAPEKEDQPPTDLLQVPESTKKPKLSIRRKVSIHFKGKKEKAKKVEGPETSRPKTPMVPEKKHSIFDIKFGNDKSKIFHQKTPSLESKKSATETNVEPKTPTSSDSKNSEKKSTCDKKARKSQSASPDRNKHVHVKEEGSKKHKKHKRPDRSRTRRATLNSIEQSRNLRERSFSVCTDRSNMLEHRLGLGSSFVFDDYSDRERTNSLSSCDTLNTHRKMSTFSNIQMAGKLPWCGCWGNGCL